MIYTLLIILVSFTHGQVLPTVPANIFRISMQNYNSSSSMISNEQQFGIHGISKAYFDNTIKNDFGAYTSSNDLYHIGSNQLSQSVTIGSFLNEFNSTYGTNLPIFDAGYVDTSRSVISNGVLSEERKQDESGRSIKIDYGISNDIMLSIEIPTIGSLNEKYSNSATIDRVYGADGIINYHQNAKTKIDSFFQTNSFITLPTGVRDTLETIYDQLYSLSSNSSVLWALHGRDNPFLRGFIDPRFMTPNYSQGDTVVFDSLISFYSPKNRSASGIGDVSFGVTALLYGSPSWSNVKASVLYGKLYVSVPFGYTIERFSAIGFKQLTKMNIGAGVSRISFGLFGGYNWNDKANTRLFGSISMASSGSEVLNTPLNLFAGAHTNPDSMISRVGETYKFKEGNWFKTLIGFETELIDKRLLVKCKSLTEVKSKDDYSSLDKNWDTWMEGRKGYDTEMAKWDYCVEAWILNSTSKARIGPLSFDFVFGYKNTISAKNTFEGYKLYSGITTYLQGW